MKIVRDVFLGVVFLALIVGVGVFIFLGTFGINSRLPQITLQVSKALARSVTIGHVGLAICRDGIALDVGPVVIADDADFTSQPFISVDRVRLGLDAIALISHRQIRITSILLRSPEIHIIRSDQGAMNFESIVSHAARPAALKPNNSFVESQERKTTVTASPLLYVKSIKSIKIRQASVSFIDQNPAFPLDIWVSDINAGVDDFSLTKPFKLSLEARTLSNTPNVHVNAVVSLNDHLDVAGSDLTFHTNLSQLDVNQVKGASPELAHIENLDITKMVLSHLLGTISEFFTLPDHLLDGEVNGKLTFSAHDNAVSIEDSLVQTKNLDFFAKGSVDKALNTNVETVLRLGSDVSLSLAGRVEMLKFLMDENKRIAIPARVSGVFPHLEYKLDKDFRKKIKKAFKKEGPKQIINDVLNNFLR